MSKRNAASVEPAAASAAAGEAAPKKQRVAPNAFVLVEIENTNLNSVEVFDSYPKALAAKTTAMWKKASKEWDWLRSRPIDKLSPAPVRFRHVHAETPRDVLIRLSSLLLDIDARCATNSREVHLTSADFHRALDAGFKFEEVADMVHVFRTDSVGIGYPVPSQMHNVLDYLATIRAAVEHKDLPLEEVPSHEQKSAERHFYNEIASTFTWEIKACTIQ